MKRFVGAACLLCMLLTVTLFTSRSAFAASSDSASYGAIAYSMANSTPYFAFADTKAAAEADALSACYQAGASDCNVPIWVQNGYLSIAIDFSWSNPSDRPWGTGWGPTPADAEQYAKEGCVSHNGNAQTCLVSTQSITPQSSASGGSGWGALSSKTGKAIAWGFQQLGSGQWNGQCEVFVENSFGTQYQAPDAQTAFNRYHTSTDWNPNIGSLVFFVPNNGNGNNGHVGLYVGDGQFISATYSGVKLEDMSAWSSNVATYEGWGDAPSSWPGR
jgi:Domain of unknown function (DUF4189)/NlpC/P60 family